MHTGIATYFFLMDSRGFCFGAWDTQAEAEAFNSPHHCAGDVWAALPDGSNVCVERRIRY